MSSQGHNEASIIFEAKTYLKFTGDTVMVLFASKIMVPLTAGSFLLILINETNKEKKLPSSISEKKRMMEI